MGAFVGQLEHAWIINTYMAFRARLQHKNKCQVEFHKFKKQNIIQVHLKCKFAKNFELILTRDTSIVSVLFV